ncbi:MAG: hypothetical protein WCW53_16735 [Syntrophales bacterium]
MHRWRVGHTARTNKFGVREDGQVLHAASMTMHKAAATARILKGGQ